MKQSSIVLFLIVSFFNLSQIFGQSSENYSVNYAELMARYAVLNSKYNTCDLISFGLTDSGEPLHLLLINSDGEFYPEAIHNKTVLLIQNGIHAGEPCGVDASIEWAEEMLANNTIPENVVIGIIPVYNIGGIKNRGCCSRANQNGPSELGFRGNARNLDLNRDYIKADSKNAMAFYRLFHWLKPELLIDTHTSNGADYQYTMTLLTTRKERLDPHLSQYLATKLEPYIYANFDSLSPYVNVFGTTPNNGIKSFNDLPRFTTGYAALFNCIGFTTEAHMWKPFDERKKATTKFIKLLTKFANENAAELQDNKRITDAENPRSFEAVNLKLDTSRFDSIEFLSFAPEFRYSDILGKDQLYYNRNKPEVITIPYYNYFNKTSEINVPSRFVISGSWKEVVQRLQANNMQMVLISEDTIISGVGTYVKGFESSKTPYEGHFLHTNIVTVDSNIAMQFYAGDYMISTKQPGWKYLLQVLITESKDSFFAWNFYDEIAQQKEWYSAYVFEPYAQEMLANDVFLQMEYDHRLEVDPMFSEGSYRLYWLYTKSPFYESVHNRVPILKIYE